MSKQIGKILPYKKFNTPNPKENLQDLFISACAYVDVAKIKLYIKNKIIINIQHFYVLITGFIWKRALLDKNKRKNHRGTYKYTQNYDEPSLPRPKKYIKV